MYQPTTWTIAGLTCGLACISYISTVFGRCLSNSEDGEGYLRRILLGFDSTVWMFLVASCPLLSTNNDNYMSCTFSVISVITLYTIVRIAFLVFITEKIHVLSAPKLPRYRSVVYWIGLGLIFPYLILTIPMTLFRVVQVQVVYPFHCTIGFGLPASLPTLCYDVLSMSVYIGMFVRLYYMSPARSNSMMNVRVISKRSGIACVIALLTHLANWTSVIALNGQELGAIILIISSLDITATAMTLHWLSSHPSEMLCFGWSSSMINKDKSIPLEIRQHQEVVILDDENE